MPCSCYCCYSCCNNSTLLCVAFAQTLVGGHEPFDAFFKAYLAEHQFKTVTSEGFRSFFMNYFAGNPAVQQVRASGRAWL